ncbi:MAG: hypothetical protein ACRD3G_08210 [Vicinamibacterales bacterium]
MKPTVSRITAIGFAAGSMAHAIGFVLLWFDIFLYGPGYPPWRHAAMSTVDLLVAWIALNRPTWLFVALPAWTAEQWMVNGFGPFPLIVLVVVIALAWERWCGSRKSRNTFHRHAAKPVR